MDGIIFNGNNASLFSNRDEEIVALEICGRNRMSTRHIYSLAIGLFVCTLIIIGKLLFISPCVPTSPKDPTCSYIIDGWSLAGLAATMMGVAATLLAILGAVAVAA